MAINSRDLEMLNFLDALWMPLSPRPSSAYEHPRPPDQEFLIFWPILNISCFPPEAAPSLTLQVAPGSKFRYATLTSTPLLAYDICLQQTHCGSIYDSWFLAVRLSVNLAHCHGQVLGIEWNWHVEKPRVAHEGSLATVCEPHTALEFPEKMAKNNKKSNRTLKFTCSNCNFQLESSQMILKTSKHHIAAAPLAQMESLQSLLPAVLPCKHQRCVVPTLDEENCGRLWQ